MLESSCLRLPSFTRSNPVRLEAVHGTLLYENLALEICEAIDKLQRRVRKDEVDDGGSQRRMAGVKVLSESVVSPEGGSGRDNSRSAQGRGWRDKAKLVMVLELQV